MRLIQLLEATQPMTELDAEKVVREIELSRGGIAELVERKPVLTEMSQEKLRAEHGDIVPLFRVLALPEDKERREDGIVSTTTDWKVAVRIGRDQPGAAMHKGRFFGINMVLLRYNTPVEKCLADVDMLLEMVVDVMGGMPSDELEITSRRSGEGVSMAYLIQAGLNEHEVIADVSGIEPVVLQFGSHVSGKREVDMLHDMMAGKYDSPEEYMQHRIATKSDNEFFPPEEQEEMKARYAQLAPDVKRFLGMGS